jgi:hypothetical protein
MSPPRKRSTYKPRRDRRELAIAVLSSLAIIVATAVVVWVLRPNKDLGSSPTPLTTAATSSTAVSETTATTASADTTPSTTGSQPSP